LLTAFALLAGGLAVVLFGLYCWHHPEVYDRYFHEHSLWALIGSRTPLPAVKVGAALTVLIGVLVAG
jgi:hypothetical protein